MHLSFNDFMIKWEAVARASNISIYDWHLHQKILWSYVHSFKTESDFDGVNLNFIPFHIRWHLAEKFPMRLKELLIDTHAFDYQGAAQTFKFHMNKSDIYVKKILVPQIFRMHNSPIRIPVKNYIRAVFNYPIS